MKTISRLYVTTMVLAIVCTGCSTDDGAGTEAGCLNASWGEQTKAEADAVSAGHNLLDCI